MFTTICGLMEGLSIKTTWSIRIRIRCHRERTIAGGPGCKYDEREPKQKRKHASRFGAPTVTPPKSVSTSLPRSGRPPAPETPNRRHTRLLRIRISVDIELQINIPHRLFIVLRAAAILSNLASGSLRQHQDGIGVRVRGLALLEGRVHRGARGPICAADPSGVCIWLR
jgi:hypothetical protein